LETRTEFVINTNISLTQILTETQYKLDKDGNITDKGVTTNYLYGLGLIAQENKAEGYLTYHYDNLGSTTAITNKKGEVVYIYAYGTYGELLSGNKDSVRFLYNGMYGVMTDSNGLYYMRARYYNVDIKRFINQDVLTGTIGNSQSLNRYSYVQGNPVSLKDPFGLSPDISWKGLGHAILDLLGFIPIVGDVCDIINAVWYASEGNTLEAMSSIVSALPGMGSFVGAGIKWGAKGAKTATKIADTIMLTTKIASNVGTIARGSYEACVSGKQIYTDIKNGKSVNGWDIFKLGLNIATVGIAGKGLKNNISTGISSKKQAKQIEQVEAASSGVVKGGSQAVEGTSKTWSKTIRGTQDIIPGTNIPKSFVMEGTMVNGKEVWVHGNATKHMGEFVNSAKGSILVENELMGSFQSSVKQILPNVNSGKNFFSNINGWEIGINGDTGVIYHALYRGGK
jgi:RHS repeat-associated protein